MKKLWVCGAYLVQKPKIAGLGPLAGAVVGAAVGMVWELQSRRERTH